jgi:hypothetical protein
MFDDHEFQIAQEHFASSGSTVLAGVIALAASFRNLLLKYWVKPGQLQESE